METYQQVLDYLYQSLPMYQRVGAVAYKPDLKNTLALCSALDHPEQKFKSIHVAGTNGKGSSSHMIAAALQSAGYRVGLYTSPHLKDFTERIRMNGQPAPQHFIVDFVKRMKPVLEEIKPSFFETTVAMAFDYFAKEKVDIAVIEVGLGGRLDSTNVITPLVSLITNISWDHMELLGDTLPKIAAEKAGIIKPHLPVVISEHQSETDFVFVEKAKQMNTAIQFASDLYNIESLGDGKFSVTKNDQKVIGELDLKGDYQRKNLAGVLAVIDQLRKEGFALSEENVWNGLKNTTTFTGLKGRWQKLNDRPLMVCDTGHNEAGIREVLHQISKQKYEKLFFVLGMVKDKDIDKVLKQLPSNAYYYFCQAKIPRALSALELKEKAAACGLSGEVVTDVNKAIAAAKSRASDNDMIFIGGSTFVVAEVNEL
jgi:dihydrofolate synthase/folylpolyglutamate synthase